MQTPDISPPNLFTFATSELSQDAFLAWLCSWAKPELVANDASLNSCAQSFIKILFDKCDKPCHKTCPDIKTIRIQKQYYGIDVLCIVNEQYYIIIEDKTNTKDHSGQLLRYANEISNNLGIKEENILKIYLKTSDQSSYHSVREQGYASVKRGDILSVLKDCQTNNQILLDYRERLEGIDAEFKQYKSINKDSELWNKFITWMGFYQDIQARLLKDGLLPSSTFDNNDSLGNHWHIVNSPSGGFVAFFWGGFDLQDEQGANGSIHMQLEHDKFAFKAGWAPRNKPEQFLKIHHALLAQSPINCGECGEIKIIKPARMRLSGTSATVAIVEGGYMQFKEDGTLDIDKTYALIKALMIFMGEIKNQLSAPQLSPLADS